MYFSKKCNGMAKLKYFDVSLPYMATWQFLKIVQTVYTREVLWLPKILSLL